MSHLNVLTGALDARLSADVVAALGRPCRPRVLMVTDGQLNFLANDHFGLWRFIQAITLAPGVVTKPVLTLAHRSGHEAVVTVGTDTYTVKTNFKFDTASPAVTLANYDQIWLFGFEDTAFPLSADEVGVVSQFMNGGGGVFATGDHASLGRALCGSLPRIRRMREWRPAASGGVPMGIEDDVSLAVNRIDTVVNPGGNGLYEFSDQSDLIPQRIYPNYQVTDTDGLAGPAWQARIHPVLMLPGASSVRSSGAAGGANTGFTKDMDALPDHPHESQCYAVSAAAVLDDTYTEGDQRFAEWQPSVANPAQRTGAQIVAYAVSGGRSVERSSTLWKPPVRPRMFGVISAYDGRLAQPYPGKTQRPGRILCDSTWHHYVNINLDGTNSGRTGLGTGSGLGFVPSPDLEKIYTYYRNTISWLQPANRVWCRVFWDLVAVRVNPALLEELLDRDRLTGWRDWVGVGREVRQLLELSYGREYVRDQVSGLLQSEEATQQVGDLLATDAFAATALDADELLDGVLGALQVEMADILPDQLDAKSAKETLADGPGKHMRRLGQRLVTAVEQGVMHQMARVERTMKLGHSIKLQHAS
jgi:hypothetical protein